MARANSIKVALSNPCFELWLVLHFREHSAWLDNDGARRLRCSHDGRSDKGIAGVQYMPLRGVAAERAERLERWHAENGTVFPHDNPSSGMHRLLAALKP